MSLRPSRVGLIRMCGTHHLISQGGWKQGAILSNISKEICQSQQYQDGDANQEGRSAKSENCQENCNGVYVWEPLATLASSYQPWY